MGSYAHSPASPSVPSFTPGSSTSPTEYSYMSDSAGRQSHSDGDGQPLLPNTLAPVLERISNDPQNPQPSQHVTVFRRRQPSQGNVKVYNTVGITSSDSKDLLNEERELDINFKRSAKPRNFFVVGKVFLILWAEPAGEPPSGAASTYTAVTSGISLGRYGQRVFSKIRRFIVVRAGDQSCSALPIITYGGQGVSKPGVKKCEHAIVYTGKRMPSPDSREIPARGEQGLLPMPIRIDPDSADEKLDPLSRLDFGKIYTIEHNTKVRSLGKINRNSEQAFLYQFKTVWGEVVVGASTGSKPTSPYDLLIANGYSEEEAHAAAAALKGSSRPRQKTLDSIDNRPQQGQSPTACHDELRENDKTSETPSRQDNNDNARNE